MLVRVRFKTQTGLGVVLRARSGWREKWEVGDWMVEMEDAWVQCTTYIITLFQSLRFLLRGPRIWYCSSASMWPRHHL